MAEDQFLHPSLEFKVLGPAYFATFGRKSGVRSGVRGLGSGVLFGPKRRAVFSKKATPDLDKTGLACRSARDQKPPFWKNSARVAGPFSSFFRGFWGQNSRM